MLAWKDCPICASRFTVHLQEIYLQRQVKTTPQYYCMTCRSFFHRSDYIENSEAHENDATWLLEHPGVENADLAHEIVNVLAARRVFEAGCGVGELLLAVQALGASAEGIDPNPSAVALARQNGAEAAVGYFDGLPQPVEAILAIDVIEHVPDPRAFFRHLVESIVEGGIVIVRVPEVNENAWHYLDGADRARENIHSDPFVDNSVHINHFSAYGLRLMGESLGAKYVSRIVGSFHLFRKA